MFVANYIILVIIIIALGILYQKFCEKQSLLEPGDSFSEIRKYLLNESSLAKSKKPILWIHVPHEYNSREWLSFGSRSSFEVNQPYLYLTVRSIIKQCDQSFYICIIDDKSFANLIPGWNIDLTLLADPILSNVRQLALAKLIHAYGGINVPISFLCCRDLIGLYEKETNGDTMFVCENVNMNITSTTDLYYPDARFFGAKKNNEVLAQYIEFMQRIISADYTAQSVFLGDFDRWCHKRITAKRLRLIPGTDIGIKTLDEEPVTVDTLLGEDYIHFYPKMYGIWIPADQILKRVKYEWFARMSVNQIFQGNFILAKYIVLATAPDAKQGVIEPLITMEGGQPDWISFWKVPINSNSHTLNIFGQKPMGLGNNVPRAKNAGNLP
jgi:hypothetical protein